MNSARRKCRVIVFCLAAALSLSACGTQSKPWNQTEAPSSAASTEKAANAESEKTAGNGTPSATAKAADGFDPRLVGCWSCYDTDCTSGDLETADEYQLWILGYLPSCILYDGRFSIGYILENATNGEHTQEETLSFVHDWPKASVKGRTLDMWGPFLEACKPYLSPESPFALLPEEKVQIVYQLEENVTVALENAGGSSPETSDTTDRLTLYVSADCSNPEEEPGTQIVKMTFMFYRNYREFTNFYYLYGSFGGTWESEEGDSWDIYYEESEEPDSGDIRYMIRNANGFVLETGQIQTYDSSIYDQEEALPSVPAAGCFEMAADGMVVGKICDILDYSGDSATITIPVFDESELLAGNTDGGTCKTVKLTRKEIPRGQAY